MTATVPTRCPGRSRPAHSLLAQGPFSHLLIIAYSSNGRWLQVRCSQAGDEAGLRWATKNKEDVRHRRTIQSVLDRAAERPFGEAAGQRSIPARNDLIPLRD